MSHDIVGSIDRSSGSYEYDEFRVVKSHETGAFYYATDSGCSCPLPFESEDADFPRAWTPITRRGDNDESWLSFVRALESWRDESENLTMKEVLDFIEKIEHALTEKK